ncbi:hypothetical protein DRP43_02280 [candidate division TA06 bacterium]|uniref:DUF4168 domain-containing protein n=1 Tax=candidate division TA06 bacterium TaxID=2250710 RepID=A0A660SNP7_UNCT6|nr:MAG: hypothetical protein DRP43_02280 [candidate division TA06 bacterium]
MRYLKILTIVMIVLITMISCKNTGEKSEKPAGAEQKLTNENRYIPPADGIIADNQLYTYIKVAQKLQIQINENAIERNNLLKKFNVQKEDQLIDTLFMKKHKKLQEALINLEEVWKKRENKMYNELNITEDEFVWIASALTDSINADKRKIVRDSLKID